VTIILPPASRSTDYQLRPVRNSEPQRAGTGGSLTPLSRLGDHWAVEVAPGVLATLCGRRLLADIVRGVGERIRVPIPQPGLDTGEPGSSVVRGNGQSGSTLALTRIAPHYPFQKGQFVTVVTAGGASAHILTADVAASAGGEATLSFWPLLWLAPSDGDRVEVRDPFLEGLIVDEGGQSSSSFAAVTTDSFTIEEG
jgi:hypothetical protein